MIPVAQYSEHSVILSSEQTMTAYLVHFVWDTVDLYAISPFPMVAGDPA